MASSDSKYIGDIDMDKIVFAPMSVDKARKSVNMYKDDRGSSYEDRIQMRLNKNEEFPVKIKWPLDTPQNEDASSYRRNLQIVTTDQKCIQQLEALDERVKKEAKIKCREWFKKDVSDDEIRFRYKPLVTREEGPEQTIKLKVVLPNPDEPRRTYTQIHRLDSDKKRIVRNVGQKVVTKDSEATVLVSTQGLWFMDQSFGISLRAESLLVKPATVLSDTEKMGLAGKYTEVEDDEKEPSAKMQRVSDNADRVPGPEPEVTLVDADEPGPM